MADIISLLPDHVANQIAAGEVIQRPASVVKELLENAIDAKATKIQLLINGAGKTLIQVIDNGIGMSATDVRLAFERHATSKIKSADDLYSITSKGFRGEALASIAAIAHVEVHTKNADDEIGNCLIISGTDVEKQDVSVVPQGTSVAVKNLFYNVPARRNFLKSDQVELRHIIDEFHRVALTHPEIRFTFLQNGSELFDLPVSNHRKRIANIFGNKIEEKLIPVEEMTSVAGIEGFVVKPEFAKKSRGQQFFFVNHRFIKSSFLHHAVAAAFEGLLRDQYKPGYFIYIQIDPKTIDINIHPTKTEIKFEDEQNLYAIIKSMVKHSLGMFQAAPVLDFDRDPSLDTPYALQQKPPTEAPAIEVDSSFNPFQTSGKNTSRKAMTSWESLYSGLDFPAMPTPSDEELKLAVDHVSKVFQWLKKYIITPTRSGLLVIDQQRAHQRILYEQFLKSITDKNLASQQLIFPKSVELSPQHRIFYEELEENLKAMGFVVTQQDGNLSITGVPVYCDGQQLDQLFEDIFSSIEDPAVERFSQGDYLAKVMSKSLCIKPNTPLTVLEQQALVDDLFACKDSLTCPFNRQIFITLDKEELEKKFT
ncbi:MAG: DNA mismatch repair endonuclease MutL [Flavobacteriia bacterium]|nr:DNA mismatch repair endonuclease MutL [Flavobacteriia bacterium]